MSVYLTLLSCAVATTVQAAPGDIIFAEYFNNNGDFNGDWTASGSGAHAVDDATFSSPSRALALNQGDIIVTTRANRIPVAVAVVGAELSVWVRRGSDEFSENPDMGEDLALEYLASNGAWTELRSWNGGGTPGEIFQETITLPAAALHAGLRLRFIFAPASGSIYDYWHIDDVVVTETEDPNANICQQIFTDSFSSTTQFNARWNATGSGNHQINGLSFNSAPASLAMWAGNITVTSRPGLIDTNVPAAQMDVWIRRGSDAFSEDTDAGEDLFLEYQTALGVWQPLQVWLGAGTKGEVIQTRLPLPALALHGDLRLRFRFPKGSGSIYDYWHIDDLNVSQVGVCSTPLDHFDVFAASTASTCEAHPINIQAILADGNVDTGYVGTVSLSTSSGHGDWVIAEGQGVLLNGPANSGQATYTFSPLDNGGALTSGTLLALKNAAQENVNINVDDGAVTELSNNALPNDPTISYRNSLLRFSPVGSQISGKPSNVAPMAQALHIEAISTNPANGLCERRLPPGPHALQFAAECINPSTCALANAMQVQGTNIPVNASGNVTAYNDVSLNFDGNARASYRLNYFDAGRVAVHARVSLADEPAGPAITLAGNSVPFVVRPFGFHVDVAGNPAAANAGGAVFKKAGEEFSATVRAVAWQAADDLNADGAPDLTDANGNADLADNAVTPNFGDESTRESATLGNNLLLPTGGVNPVLLNNTFIEFSGGAKTNLVRWDEVGIIQLQASLQDSQYLGFAASAPATANVISAHARTGRFVPDHFHVQGHTLLHRTELTCPAAGFSYLGEPATLQLQLQARNTGNAITQNYVSAFAKLNNWSNDSAVDELQTGVIDAVTNANLSARLALASPSVFTWSNGVGETSGAIALNRAATPDGILLTAFGIAPADDDGVGLLPAAIDMDVDGDGSNDHGRLTAVLDSEEFRYGRVRIDNAFGPETRDLPVAMVTEYFDAGSWRVASDDSCTQLLNSELIVDGGGDFDATVGGGSSAAVPAAPLASGFGFNNGDAGLLFSAPGDGNVGQFDLSANLTNYPWLQFDWNGDGAYNNNPAAVITFGQYRGNDHIIYWREVH